MAARREYIRPNFDPVIVTLDKGPDVCTQREGQDGVDYQYFVNSNSCIMYLPKAGRDALVQSGAKAGDSVEICMSKGRAGATVYFAQRVNDSHEPAAPPARPLAAVAVTEAPRATYAPVPQPQQGGLNATGEQLAYCLKATIDALAIARDYAKTKGIELNFNEEDCRTLAVTAFISKAGR
jgi:hypothetical protein